jgi:hypothetical protein
MSSKAYYRTPQNYDGTRTTSKRMTDLLPKVLDKIDETYQQRGDLILVMWPEIIGPKLAGMTEAVSFLDGVLHVKVKNSTLHSLLSQNEKFRLLSILRQRFPRVEIRALSFRIG